MANDSHESMIIQGNNFAVMIPVVLTTGSTSEIESLGTVIKHEAIVDTTIDIPTSASAKSEYISTTMDNGTTLEVPKVTTTLDATTGSEKAGSGSDANPKISFTTLEVSRTAFSEIVGHAQSGTPIFLCVGLGKTTTGAQDGYAFMLGKISSNLQRGTKGNEFVNNKLEFSGVTATAGPGVTGPPVVAEFDETALNDDTTGFGVGVEPMGDAAITAIIHSTGTSNVFTSGELAELLAGKIVFKAA